MHNLQFFSRNMKVDGDQVSMTAADTTIEQGTLAPLIEQTDGGVNEFYEYLQSKSGQDHLVEFFQLGLTTQQAGELLVKIVQGVRECN